MCITFIDNVDDGMEGIGVVEGEPEQQIGGTGIFIEPNSYIILILPSANAFS